MINRRDSMTTSIEYQHKKYMHVERFGTLPTKGIENGLCYIFPKLDGTNASVWAGLNGEVKTGSRNREVTPEDDNAGFAAYVRDNKDIQEFMRIHTHLRLHGEWLCPHTIKTYVDDAWRKFYIFDIFDQEQDRLLTYPEIVVALNGHDINHIPPICTVNDPLPSQLIEIASKNTYLMKEGGIGEGIVVKRYDFKNFQGETIFAKVIHESFKHTRVDKSIKHIDNTGVESLIVEEFITIHLVDKVMAKICNEKPIPSGTLEEIRQYAENNALFESKDIPKLLNIVFYDLVTEETYNFIKRHRMPTVDFKKLQTLCYDKVKELKRGELFQ